MTRKYKHSVDTLEGTIEWEDENPPSPPPPPPPTPEEIEAEREREHHDSSIASYLHFPCYYCGNKFYLVEPIRYPGYNPLLILLSSQGR